MGTIAGLETTNAFTRWILEGVLHADDAAQMDLLMAVEDVFQLRGDNIVAVVMIIRLMRWRK